MLHNTDNFSKISMHITRSSPGTNLNGSPIPQTRFVNITVTNQASQVIMDIAMTFEQLAHMLVSNMDTDCTLTRYFNEGDRKCDTVKVPESPYASMKRNLGDAHTELMDRMTDIQRDLYEMVNGGSSSKSKIKELLQSVEVLQSHYKSNLSFHISEAENKLQNAGANLMTQIALAVNNFGVDVSPEVIKNALPMEMSFDAPANLALPAPESNVTNYVRTERETKPVEAMTAMEVADALSYLLCKEEIRQSKLEVKVGDNSAHAELYCTNCINSGNSHVSICYVCYQHHTKLTLADAKVYLKYLLTATTFTKHYTVLK